MSWEDQGRQYHEWFGHGTAPVALKPIVEKDGSMIEDSLDERVRTVVHGALGALPRKLRRQAEGQVQSNTLGRLTDAMTAWVHGTRMDAASFAHHFFGRAADDPVAGSLRAAATETAEATTRPQLAAASQHLADAMTTEGLDGWPRFVTQAQLRAQDNATLAAVAKSLQPVVPRLAADGKSGSGMTGSGTKLAMAPAGEPDEISEGGGKVIGHGGGAMPDIGPPTAGGAGPPPATEPLPLPSGPTEVPAAKPAAPPATAPDTNPAPTVEAKGGRPAQRATVSPERRVHILDGDKTGGGHRAGTGKPNKAEFPVSWSDAKAIAEIESVANDPSSKRVVEKDGRIKVEGTRDGIAIRVILEPDQVTIVTAYPINVPRNPRSK